jgi:hypothetical protein
MENQKFKFEIDDKMLNEKIYKFKLRNSFINFKRKNACMYIC